MVSFRIRKGLQDGEGVSPEPFHFAPVHLFVVQLEIETAGLWKVALRYDTFHGYAHKDCYDIQGKCRKINLYLEFEDAMTMADEDMDENWELYREKFLKGEFP